jgi:transposase
MEACWRASPGPEFGTAGHGIRLMSPEYVRPYVKANRNDDRDAQAIAEGATRPTIARHIQTRQPASAGEP